MNSPDSAQTSIEKPPFKILFVCSTGTSISPLLAALFLERAKEASLQDQVVCQIAGSHAGASSRPPYSPVMKYAAQNGLNLEHYHSIAIEKIDLESYDLITTANEDHFWHIRAMMEGMEQAPDMDLMLHYSGQSAVREMPDPLLEEVSIEEAYQLLDKAARGLLEEIKGRLLLRK